MFSNPYSKHITFSTVLTSVATEVRGHKSIIESIESQLVVFYSIWHIPHIPTIKPDLLYQTINVVRKFIVLKNERRGNDLEFYVWLIILS